MVKISGTVKSFVQQKKFGFINGEDQKSYFFHASSLVERDKGRVHEIKAGSLLRFEPTPSRRGLRASKTEIVQTYTEKRAIPFSNCRDRKPKKDVVIASSHRAYTRFSKCPHEARRRIETLAKLSGGNVVYDLKMNKSTGSNGNHKF
ncbi:MAG: cold-shock protein, partial [Flavobacteriaceae bacterium]